MATPANAPESPVPSETPLDAAVLPELAVPTEVVTGMQSPTPEVDPYDWEGQLKELERQEAAAKANPVAAPADGVTPTDATVPPVEQPPEAGVAASGDQTTDDGAQKFGPQYRVRPGSETDNAVLALKARNPDMTIEEALAKVKGPTPLQTDAAPAVPVVPPTVAAQNTMAEIEAEQERLNTELRAAYADMDGELQGELAVKINSLVERKMIARAELANAEAAENAEWDRKVSKAEQDALRLYPALEAPNSALFERVAALHATMTQNGDPTLNDPACALRLAQMAAAQLGIGPVVAAKAPAPAQAAIPTVPTPVRPAAGGTVGGTAPPQSAQDLDGSDRWTPEQWDTYNEKHFSRR